MTRILVAEDSPTQAQEIRLRLESEGYQVEHCADGAKAQAAIRRSPPDAVLTDLEMPEVNGLELVEWVRAEFPAVPVLVMTAFGSEETAIAALQRGAASYVPKKNLARELIETLQGVLSMVQAAREQKRLSECLTESRCSFRLENDAALVVPIVAQVQDDVIGMKLLDENESIRIGVALEQAILNAIFHGNLELSSQQLRDAYHLEDGGKSYYQLLDERRRKPPFSDRRVYVEARVSRDEAVCTVRDEGPGFDHSALPKAGDIATLERDHHRGLFLIANFMDEVRFNDAGNEITMVKRRPDGK